MIIHKLLGPITDWLAERMMRKYRKRREPTAYCHIPDIGPFNLIQGVWEGDMEAAGFELGVCIDLNAREIRRSWYRCGSRPRILRKTSTSATVEWNGRTVALMSLSRI